MAKDVTDAVSKIQQAGSVPDAWPEALKSLTDALGVEGAACIIFNKKTRGVDWAYFSGLSAELESKYIEHYARLDPFSPLLYVLPGWTKLSECLPGSVLEKSEWYNDFVLACGVRDAFGTRLVDTPSHSAVFGVHRQIGRSFGNKTAAILDAVTGTLSAAMQRRVERLVGAVPSETATKIAIKGERYYFHVGEEFPDQTGTVLASQEEAIAYASSLAAELEQDKDWAGFVVRVVDEAGTVVARIAIG